ncbi:DUF2471 family protein [Noviherbaspirillum sp. ST9]|uniref:DUF2471 family protein n=1 Tax=Noviherbaspirillum sp. ST9 TaxID=3401606 RepID=UPI002D2387E5|nr:hypothetical protein [Noviherbaspirillum sp.]
MKFFEVHKLHAAEARLALAVDAIVERHRTEGRPLTWRLVHEIEKEALKTLEQAGDLDRKYVRMLKSSRWGYVPRVNQPADLRCHDALPVTLTLIRKAYHTLH